ncbi:MAG: hypothetical protein WBP34_06935 [Thermoanaerobaculia bacterium]
MQRRGIVDLGSNTARLVDYLVEPGQWYRLVHQIRQPVRLGEGLGRDGLISKAAMRRAEKALELFGQYATSTKLDWLEVLGTSALRDAAAVLQDVGLAVNYYRHDRHGGDLVASAPLNGFTHREQVLLALLVRFHLRGKPRLGAYRRLCQPDDEKLLTRLAACLRLADHLDRSRSQTVEDLSVDIGEQEVRVDAYSCRDPRIELDGIEAHESIFESGFGRRLTVRGVVGSTSPE